MANLKIAVNVSSTQLQAPNFIPRLDRLIDETGIDPERFELELTESVLLDESGHTRDKLQALRRRGFSLALDDFGAGYSSLSYLQHFPINKIKIDRSFVTNLRVGREADEIIGAIVKLARALKLSVLAGGGGSRPTNNGCGCRLSAVRKFRALSPPDRWRRRI